MNPEALLFLQDDDRLRRSHAESTASRVVASAPPGGELRSVAVACIKVLLAGIFNPFMHFPDAGVFQPSSQPGYDDVTGLPAAAAKINHCLAAS